MVDFKGAHYPKGVIVHAVFFYVQYAVSYRDLEEILITNPDAASTKPCSNKC
jgi:transposase-like protein